MASLVGAFAASHGPLIVREWQRVPPEQQRRMSDAYRELGRRLTAAKPEVLIVVSPDHWSNFFLDNYPAVCIGVGEENEGPPEPWMKAFPHRTIAGHPGLAMHLADEAMRQGFEPAVSHRLKLDHGVCIPLWRMELERLPKIVPILLNSIEPPMPSLARCFEWGSLLRKSIETYAELMRFLEQRLPTSGNGSEEVRNWLVAHGAAGGRGFELVDYLPVPKVIVGCGFAAWRV